MYPLQPFRKRYSLNSKFVYYSFLLFLISGFTIVCNSRKEHPFFEENLMKQEDIFQINDEDYFDNPYKFEDSVLDKQFQKNTLGIFIGCPKFIDIETKKHLPMLFYECRTFKDIRFFPLSDFAVISVTDLDRGKVHTNLLEPMVDEPIEPEPERPTADSLIPEGRAAQFGVYDLRNLLQMRWVRSNLLVTLFLHDQYSNRVFLSMGETGDTPESIRDAVLADLEKYQYGSATIPDIILYPQYEKQENSPDVPEQTGIVLRSDPSFTIENDDPYNVYGSFNLQAFDHELIPESDEHNFSAVVPLTFIISGSLQGVIGTMNVSTPAQLNTEKNAHTVGYFTLDLKKHFQFYEEPQEVIVYVSSRAHLNSLTFLIED
ncbi:hypothetical protein CHISP_2905 [Chitinispirillum alkaliphilum]|nr:hypothetical protein CHISP_2905 [Chitinispirillum alkaliphilum]